MLQVFQSTLPAREATGAKRYITEVTAISIHASRKGSDILRWIAWPLFLRFQSTLPAREATRCLLFDIRHIQISIHASRKGSDLMMDRYLRGMS